MPNLQQVLQVKKLLYVYILVLSAAWLPHSLDRIHALGYDFPFYWLAGQGITGDWYVWSEYVRWTFVPLSWFSLDAAFVLSYILMVLCWLDFARRFPVLGFLATYPFLLGLELGQQTLLLAWLCLYPMGAVAAMCYKPYLIVFVALHAWLMIKSGIEPWKILVLEVLSAVLFLIVFPSPAVIAYEEAGVGILGRIFFKVNFVLILPAWAIIKRIRCQY